MTYRILYNSLGPETVQLSTVVHSLLCITWVMGDTIYLNIHTRHVGVHNLTTNNYFGVV